MLPVIHKINRLPILIAQGSNDILTPDYIHRNVMNHLKNAQLVEVKESGHWTVLEQPEQIRLLTESFLKTSH
ncbi:alpha/beta fold hydrolase [Rossellomorea vietnamensis]|uniref:alpha/beta fold hydrolase n=1 Tax=Rossellomorea vietnamensis TaxID=218284 RepID=UPI003CEC3273